MAGGLAVAGNLLCVAHSGARGRVFLLDLEEARPLSVWDLTAPGEGYSDAGGIALDAEFTLYVADTVNDRVRHYTAFGRSLGGLGRPAEGGPGAARRDRPGVLDRPRAVAVAGEVVYVACGERKLRRGLQRFGRDGRALRTLPAFGDPQARWGAPRGLWAGARELFVADTLNGCVQRYRLNGAYLGHFATGSRPDERSRPVAVAQLADGSLLVLDEGDRVGLRRFTPSGEDLGPPAALAAVVEEPVAVARDEGGEVFVLDRTGERVVRCGVDLASAEPIVDLREVLDEG